MLRSIAAAIIQDLLWVERRCQPAAARYKDGKMTVPPASRTARFARRRAEILAVATEQINLNGTRGMTLTAVARALGLDTSSVTYYFKRKDQLAAACLERTLDWQQAVATAAAAEPDPRSRVRAFLHAFFEQHRRHRDPAAERLALLSDMAALDAELRAPLDAKYAATFRIVRGFFAPEPGPDSGAQTLIAAAVLFANAHWLAAWQDRYHADDFARIEARLCDVLENGLAPGRDWPVVTDQLETDDGADSQARFLHAATDLINRQGYLGASVDRIAAELGVSTGSFYHHLSNKDDLVVACFERTFAMVRRAGEAAAEHGGTMGEQLARLIASLVALQFAGASPMLRASAYQALPPDLRERMLRRTGRNSRHIAGMISDGIADRSVRPVDAVVAGHAVTAAIDAAADLRRWAGGRELRQAVALFAAALHRGIFAD